MKEHGGQTGGCQRSSSHAKKFCLPGLSEVAWFFFLIEINYNCFDGVAKLLAVVTANLFFI